jgi:hypothetical protein
VVEVAPGMELKVTPESVDTSHCTLGLGQPVADALKEAFPPAAMVWLDGFSVTAGMWVTWSIAAVVFATPAELVNCALYSSPF